MSVSRRPFRTTFVVAVLAGLALAGCGSSSKSSSSSGSNETTTAASAATAVCKSLDQLRSSVSALPSSVTGGKDSIQAALNTVKQNLENVKSAAKSSDKPKLDALESSITDFQKALDNMNGVSGLSDVATAAKNVGQSAQAAFDALTAGCSSS